MKTNHKRISFINVVMVMALCLFFICLEVASAEHSVYYADGNQRIQRSLSYTISGYVKNSSGAAIGGVTMAASNGVSALTDSTGYYSLSVPSGWSGTVSGFKTDYNFVPSKISYTNVLFHQSNKNYTGTYVSGYPISGYVRNMNNKGIAGLSLKFGTISDAAATTGTGYYIYYVKSGWSGTVTPSNPIYFYYPKSFSYTNVTSKQIDQNYTAYLETFTVSGYVIGANNRGIEGVTVSLSDGGLATTNSLGIYSLSVHGGWSGTITPSKAGHTFDPQSRSYTNVSSNMTDKNYTRVFTVSGWVRGFENIGAGGVTITLNNNGGSTTTDSTGYYSKIVPEGWNGTVTPAKDGYGFSPPNRTYTTVSSDMPDQNYTPTHTISGYVLDSKGIGMGGVEMDYSFFSTPVITDTSGYYEIKVNHGWSGLIKVAKTGYFFYRPACPECSYTNIISNWTSQNYVGYESKFRVWIDKNMSGTYNAGEEVKDAYVWVNNEYATYTGSNGIFFHTDNPKYNDKIYVERKYYSVKSPKSDDLNFGSQADNPYYADYYYLDMYDFVMASDMMDSFGEYHDFPGMNKTLKDARKDSQGNILIQLVHPKIRWNLVVAFEDEPSAEFYNQTKDRLRNYANLLYNYTDGYSVIKNIVIVKGAYINDPQWNYCDVQIPNLNWPWAIIFGNRYNKNENIHVGKKWTFKNCGAEGCIPSDNQWISGIAHESGHYLFGFKDEYESGNNKQGNTWIYRVNNTPDEFPASYGMMDDESFHELSDITDYFPRNPPYNDEDVTEHFQWRRELDSYNDYVTYRQKWLKYSDKKGQSCWEYFRSYYQLEIKEKMKEYGFTDFSDTFFNYLIIPPNTTGSYPDKNANPKRWGPSSMNHDTVNIIDWAKPSSKRYASDQVFDAMVQIVDSEGLPIPNANVWLVSEDRKSFQGNTDKDGITSCGSLAIGKSLEAYFAGKKGEIVINEKKDIYTLVIPADLNSQQREARATVPGIIVCAKPDNVNPKQISITVTGEPLTQLPTVILSQSHSYSVNVAMTNSGNNIYLGTGVCQYNSGNLEITAASSSGTAQSVCPFEIFSTDSGPASGYYIPHGELEMTYAEDSFEGTGSFVMSYSPAPAPVNGTLKQVGNVWSIGFSGGITAVRNVGFNIPLPDIQLAGIDASQLKLYGWDSVNKRWNLIPGGINNLRFFSILFDKLNYVSYALFAPLSTDMTSPNPVTDLQAVTGDSRWRINLQWTAPSDNKGVFVYEIRFNTVPITEANWNSSSSVGYVPKPELPGTLQYTMIEMPKPDTDYYFAIKVRDASGNTSSLTALNTPVTPTPVADFNCNSRNDLADAVIALQISAGIASGACFNDADGDNKTGVAEAVYILQKVSGLRE